MRFVSVAVVLGLLSGCGAVYQGTTIREGVSDGAKVRVIAVTPETVLAAHSQIWTPKGLPAAFAATAGAGGRGAGSARAPDPVREAEPRAATPQTFAPPPVAQTPYRIGVGDVVLLATKTGATTAAELSGLLAAENRRQGYTVQDDGSIAVPDVGRVRIAGMTLEEAEPVVLQALLSRQIDPSFSIEIAEFNARRVSVGGAVVSPGVVPVTLTPLTLDATIASVGGVKVADRNSAVIRIYREGRLYQIPVEEFLRNPDLQKTRLMDGDSVFVDADFDLDRAEAYFAEQIQLAEFKQSSRQAALSALSTEVSLRRDALTEERDLFSKRLELGAEDQDFVYLAGELRTPGRMTLPFEQRPTVADAIYGGGGGVLSRTGNPRQIYVLRGSPDPREFGGITAWHIDGGTPSGMVMVTRMELRPDDVIFVAEQPVTRWNRAIDQISPSLIAIPLNDAVAN